MSEKRSRGAGKRCVYGAVRCQLIQALSVLPDLGDPAAEERGRVERLLRDAPAADVRGAAHARALGYIAAVRAADAA